MGSVSVQFDALMPRAQKLFARLAAAQTPQIFNEILCVEMDFTAFAHTRPLGIITPVAALLVRAHETAFDGMTTLEKYKKMSTAALGTGAPAVSCLAGCTVQDIAKIAGRSAAQMEKMLVAAGLAVQQGQIIAPQKTANDRAAPKP